MPSTNPYVGTAKILPDSLTPRRLSPVSRPTKPSASRTRESARPVKALMMLSTPADTETETVST